MLERRTTNLIIFLCLAAASLQQQCNDPNCASCLDSPATCDRCFSGYVISTTTGLCKVPCNVLSCAVCRVGDSLVCSRCADGYNIKALSSSSDRNECIRKSDSDQNNLFMFVIGLLFTSVVCFGILCWCIVHKKKLAAQQTHRESDLHHSMYQPDSAAGYPHAHNQLRNINQFYNPPKAIPNSKPVSHYAQFASFPAPPPGNSLFFVHRQTPGAY